MRGLYLNYSVAFSIFVCSCLECGGGSFGKLLNKDHNVQIFLVDGSDAPLGDKADRISSSKSFPENLKPEEMGVILEGLRYFNYRIFSVKSRPVFYEKDIQYLVPRLMKTLPRVRKGQRIFLVHRDMPPGNLIRTSLRNTMLLWNDKNGLNILFGEIRSLLLSKNLVYPNASWTEATEIDMDNPAAGISLEIKEPYERKELDGLEYSTWVFIPLRKIPLLLKKKIERQRQQERLKDGIEKTDEIEKAKEQYTKDAEPSTETNIKEDKTERAETSPKPSSSHQKSSIKGR